MSYGFEAKYKDDIEKHLQLSHNLFHSETL